MHASFRNILTVRKNSYGRSVGPSPREKLDSDKKGGNYVGRISPPNNITSFVPSVPFVTFVTFVPFVPLESMVQRPLYFHALIFN